MLLGLILWIPTACELHRLIAWRVNSDEILKFEENMEISHKIAEQFYRNATQCIFTDRNGIKIYVDHSTPVNFKFV